jgi:hypothetical protein
MYRNAPREEFLPLEECFVEIGFKFGNSQPDQRAREAAYGSPKSEASQSGRDRARGCC